MRRRVTLKFYLATHWVLQGAGHSGKAARLKILATRRASGGLRRGAEWLGVSTVRRGGRVWGHCVVFMCVCMGGPREGTPPSRGLAGFG